MFSKCIICVACLLVAFIYALPECQETDFKFEYTPCDQTGLRWRVSVPKRAGLCQGGHPTPPEQGKNCSFSCDPGYFLNVATQECVPCPAGRYSLGGGIRYDQFDTLPSGFHISNEFLSQSASKDEDECKNGTGWATEKGWLMYMPQPLCMSTLSYTVELNRPGHVQYTYRKPDRDNVIISISVQNEQCAKQDDSKDHVPPKNTGDSSWVTESRPLRSGHNVLKWHGVAFNSLGQQESLEPVLVDNIEIMGVAFITECSKCPAGTKSGPGESDCGTCPMDTYSSAGSAACTKCPDDKYSGEHAVRCEKRPACTSKDYFGKWGQCSDNKITVTYDWINPKICKDDLTVSVKLPSAETKECGSCNPGMGKGSNGQQCQLCPEQTFSDGSKECATCPPNTAPNYGYQFIKWDKLPQALSTACEVFSRARSGTCTSDSWLPAGHRIHTAFSRTADVMLTLTMEIKNGFSNPLLIGPPATTNPIGHVTFEFDMACVTDQCALYFIQEPVDKLMFSGGEIIAQWNGTRQKQAYRHPISSKDGKRFDWIFIRSQTEFWRESASIYIINVTNIADKLGASSCIQCPKQSTLMSQGCLPCPPGHSMDPVDHSCKKCPINMVVNQTSVSSTCIKCGPNLQSLDGVTCALPPLLNITLKNNQMTFNLSALPGSVQAKGVTIFTGEGDSYSHVFNLSLPIQPPLKSRNSTATCADNIVFANKGLQSMNKVINGLACRSTSISQEKTSTTGHRYTNSMLIASQLLGISSTPQLASWKLSPKDLSSIPNQDEVVHIFYSGEGQGMDLCPQGLAVAVSLVCDPSGNETKAQLPPQCPDGTCDGCLYHIIVTSPLACPICTDKDYTEIKGECVLGLQTIHKIPAKHCILSGEISKSVRKACKVFGVQSQVAVGVASALTVLLCSILVYVCRKNKSLEYKYMKLVANAEPHGEEGELPAAESCALQEGEEEEDQGCDRVIFSKGKNKSKGLLSKVNNRVTMEEKRAFVFDQEGPDD